jgi:ABC-type sugar transport system permease subunit
MIVASKKERAGYYLFLIPAFLVFGVFIFWPTVQSFYLSLCKYSLSSFKAAKYVGLKNYISIFTNNVFWQSMKNTAIYTLFTVPFLMAAGLLLALMIHSKLVKCKTIYKVLFYIPYVSSIVAVAIVFKLIFDPGSSGIANQILMKLGLEPQAFLADNTWAMAIVILLSIWKSIGYVMIIYLGGLLGISQDIYDAVSLEAITPWKKLTKITLPLLKPTTLFLLTTETISSFQVFTPVNVMTGGGPGYATTTLISLLYNSGFVEFNMGKASAIAVVIFVILTILTLVQNKLAADD